MSLRSTIPRPMNAENAPTKLEPPLSHIIYTSEDIAQAVRTLAIELLAATPYHDELMLLVVLEGARRFGDDLRAAMQALPQAAGRRISVATVGVSSYGNDTRSSGKVTIVQEPSLPLAGKNVVIVDDILDQGYTISRLLVYCGELEPAVLRSCVLFDKRDVRRNFRPEFVGLEVPPVFVVGYGLDYQEKFRNLPYLAALDEAYLTRDSASGAKAPLEQRERA